MTATIDLTIEPIDTRECQTACPTMADGDPVCPMTGNNSCSGADSANCTAC